MLGSLEDSILAFMKRPLKLTVAVTAFLMTASLITKYVGTPPWVAGVVLCAMGAGLYLGNALLIRSYIIRRAPEFANDEMWELTAGLGIVPRWVSFLGLLAIPAFIAAGVWFFLYYWPK
jgi:hypothetical protein